MAGGDSAVRFGLFTLEDKVSMPASMFAEPRSLDGEVHREGEGANSKEDQTFYATDLGQQGVPDTPLRRFPHAGPNGRRI